MTEGSVIVLTGPPGVGKTTTARLLADRYPRCVHLHSDDFWRFIRTGAIPPYLPESDEQNRTVIDVLAECAFGYAAGGYQVIVDGIVGPWFLDRFRDRARDRRIPLHYVVLRAAEDTTVARASGRGADELRDPEPLRHMHRQFADLGPLEPHVLTNEDTAPDRVADSVLAGVGADAYRLD